MVLPCAGTGYGLPGRLCPPSFRCHLPFPPAPPSHTPSKACGEPEDFFWDIGGPLLGPPKPTCFPRGAPLLEVFERTLLDYDSSMLCARTHDTVSVTNVDVQSQNAMPGGVAKEVLLVLMIGHLSELPNKSGCGPSNVGSPLSSR